MNLNPTFTAEEAEMVAEALSSAIGDEKDYIQDFREDLTAEEIEVQVRHIRNLQSALIKVLGTGKEVNTNGQDQR